MSQTIGGEVSVFANAEVIKAVPTLPGAVDDMAFINESSVVHDDEAKKIMAALQIQADRDFKPIWGQSTKLTFYGKGCKNPTNIAWLALLDDSDQAGALGYHDLTNDGLPLGKVFAKTDLQYGEVVSVTASHELLEMLADPYISYTMLTGQGAQTLGYAWEVCLTGDTEIPLLNGTRVPIRDLVGQKEFWVYSSTPNGSIKAGRGHSARMTKKRARIVKVELDDGSSFRCTPDHKVLCRDGIYREAGSLSFGQSLMPLYRRVGDLFSPETQTTDGYEQVYVPEKHSWRFTHRLVRPNIPKGMLRHHSDKNPLNNNPDNIQIVSRKQHAVYHAAEIAAQRMLPQCREASSGTMKRVNASHKGAQRPELCVSHTGLSTEARAAAGLRGVKTLREYNVSEAHRMRMRGNKHLVEQWKDPEFRAKVIAGSSARMKAMNHARWHNHKVVSVTLCGYEDVYDLTVDDFHNFAIGPGVFVHNCDACEDDRFAYDINGVKVSDFVYPAWFQPWRKEGSTRFDHMQKISKPLQLIEGGYIGVWTPSSGWQQMNAAKVPFHKMRPKTGQRRERRRTPIAEWALSESETE